MLNGAQAKLADNQDSWYWKTDKNAILLTTENDKKYYVLASLAAVLERQGKKDQVQAHFDQLKLVHADHLAEIQELIEFEAKSYSFNQVYMDAPR